MGGQNQSQGGGWGFHDPTRGLLSNISGGPGTSSLPLGGGAVGASAIPGDLSQIQQLISGLGAPGRSPVGGGGTSLPGGGAGGAAAGSPLYRSGGPAIYSGASPISAPAAPISGGGGVLPNLLAGPTSSAAGGGGAAGAVPAGADKRVGPPPITQGQGPFAGPKRVGPPPGPGMPPPPPTARDLGVRREPVPQPYGGAYSQWGNIDWMDPNAVDPLGNQIFAPRPDAPYEFQAPDFDIAKFLTNEDDYALNFRPPTLNWADRLHAPAGGVGDRDYQGDLRPAGVEGESNVYFNPGSGPVSRQVDAGFHNVRDDGYHMQGVPVPQFGPLGEAAPPTGLEWWSYPEIYNPEHLRPDLPGAEGQLPAGYFDINLPNDQLGVLSQTRIDDSVDALLNKYQGEYGFDIAIPNNPPDNPFEVEYANLPGEHSSGIRPFFQGFGTLDEATPFQPAYRFRQPQAPVTGGVRERFAGADDRSLTELAMRVLNP